MVKNQQSLNEEEKVESQDALVRRSQRVLFEQCEFACTPSIQLEQTNTTKQCERVDE
jgi:hypothetical protein